MRRAPLIITVLCVLLAAAWYGLHFIPADFLSSVEADFVELPLDDHELEAWLQSLPGVWHGSVRRLPNGLLTRLQVTIGRTHSGWKQPAFPDLDGKCAELGYRGQVAPFRDEQETPP